MWRQPAKTAHEHMADLIDCHDKIKAHPFRKHFQDDQNTGTFRSLCNEYRNLIYKSTEILVALCYYCSDDHVLEVDDLDWVHNFRAFLTRLYNRYVYVHKDKDAYWNTRVGGCELKRRDVLAKTGIDDINTVMIYLDRYLGYIHKFIETGVFDVITSVEFEMVTNPHNGWYYEHLVDIVKIDGKWGLKDDVQYIGTIKTKPEEIKT